MNRRRVGIAAGLIVAIVASCVLALGFRAGNTRTTEARPFAMIELALRESSITSTATTGEEYRLTLSYIAWVRSGAAGAIPKATIRRHIADLANGVAGQCPLCSAALDRELQR